MKKHNEGYTLPLVLVVMIIMCLIAVSVMSVALHNLQAQKTSITRMQDKYEAQGELEKAIANLTSQLKAKEGLHDNVTGEAAAEAAATATILTALGVNQPNTNVTLQKNPENNMQDRKVEWATDATGALSCTVFLYITDPENTMGIRCSICLKNVLKPNDNNTVFFYKTPEIVYTSYEIGGAG